MSLRRRVGLGLRALAVLVALIGFTSLARAHASTGASKRDGIHGHADTGRGHAHGVLRHAHTHFRLRRGSVTPAAPGSTDSDSGASNLDPSPFVAADVDADAGLAWTGSTFRRPRAPATRFRIRPRPCRGPPLLDS